MGFLKTFRVLLVICPHKNTCIHNFLDLGSSPGKYKVQIMSVIFKNPICARSVRIDDLDSWYDCSLHRLRDYSKVKHIRHTVSSGSQAFVVE